MAILGVTALVCYERAKAESLGLSAKGGLMERAERMVLLGVAFLSSTFVVPVLWVMFALISLTAVTRFVRVWNAASGRGRGDPPRASRPGARAGSTRAGAPGVRAAHHRAACRGTR